MEEQQKNRVRIRKTSPSFTREQRAGFVLVIGAGALAIILGLVYVFQHLSNPFLLEYEGPQFLTSEEQQLLELEEQKVTDTDGDTLSDFDELYAFRPSPYLADTDGDGYDDASELLSGTDPTCAAGAECTDEYSVSGVDQASLIDYIAGSAANSEELSQEISEVIKSFTATDVRQLLLDAGAPEEQLNQLTDEELEAFYLSVITDLEDSGELDALIDETLTE